MKRRTKDKNTKKEVKDFDQKNEERETTGKKKEGKQCGKITAPKEQNRNNQQREKLHEELSFGLHINFLCVPAHLFQ